MKHITQYSHNIRYLQTSLTEIVAW